MGVLEFLGFKKGDLDKIKASSIKREVHEQEERERQKLKELGDLQKKERMFRDNLLNPQVPESELRMLARHIEDVELKIAGTEQRLDEITKNRRFLEVIAWVQEQRAVLERSGFWSELNSMEPEELEDTIVKFGELNANTSSNIDKFNLILGTPTHRDARASTSTRQREIIEEARQERAKKFGGDEL